MRGLEGENKKWILRGIVCLILTLSFFYLSPGLAFTDSATYVQAVKVGALPGPHAFYIYLGWAIVKFTGLNPIHALKLLSALFGAFTLLPLAGILSKFVSERWVNLALMSFITLPLWLIHSLHIEVYTMGTFLLTITLYLLLTSKESERKWKLAALTFGLCLGTQTSLILLLPFIYLFHHICLPRRDYRLFIIISIILGVIFYIPLWWWLGIKEWVKFILTSHEYKLSLNLKVWFRNMVLTIASFHIYLPLAVLGLHSLYQEEKEWFKLSLAFLLPFLIFIPLNFWDAFVQLIPTYPVIILLAFIYLYRKGINLRVITSIIFSNFLSLMVVAYLLSQPYHYYEVKWLASHVPKDGVIVSCETPKQMAVLYPEREVYELMRWKGKGEVLVEYSLPEWERGRLEYPIKPLSYLWMSEKKVFLTGGCLNLLKVFPGKFEYVASTKTKTFKKPFSYGNLSVYRLVKNE